MTKFLKRTNNTSKKFAFTIVESLIFLFFSGVIIMMVIPVVNVRTQKRTLRELWKNDYIEIVRAYANVQKIRTDMNGRQENGSGSQEGRELSNSEIMKDVSEVLQSIQNGNQLQQGDNPQIQAEMGPEDNSRPSFDDVEGVEGIEKNLSVAKFCGQSEFVCGVFPNVRIGLREQSVYKTLTEGYIDENDLSQNQFLLKNGANVYTRTDSSGVTDFWIDVNGYVKGPNKLGRDLFGAVIIDNKVIPMGTKISSANNSGEVKCGPSDSYIPLGSSGSASDYAGASCSATVLAEELSSLLKYPAYRR